MKKLISLILSVLMLLSLVTVIVSCSNSDTNTTNESETNNNNLDNKTVSVATLNGTTGFGMAKLMHDNANSESKEYVFEVVPSTSVDKIMAGIVSGEYDIAALPTNAAANLYNKTNGKIKIVAINTLGVLYLVSNDNTIDSIDDLEGKTIYCPAQNPLFIAKYIIEKNNLTDKVTLDSTTYSSPDAIRAAVIAGEIDYAILPEPMVTIATLNNKNYSVVLDLTEEWNKVSGEKELVQGCVVANVEFIENNPSKIKSFLNEYKASIEYVKNPENVKQSAEYINEFEIFTNPTIAEKAIPKCNIEYVDSESMKEYMENFVNAMFEIAPASVGNKIPDENFYYINK